MYRRTAPNNTMIGIVPVGNESSEATIEVSRESKTLTLRAAGNRGYNILFSTDKSLEQVLKNFSQYLDSNSGAMLFYGDVRTRDLNTFPVTEGFYDFPHNSGATKQNISTGKIEHLTMPFTLSDLLTNLKEIDSSEKIWLRLSQYSDPAKLKFFWYSKGDDFLLEAPQYFVFNVERGMDENMIHDLSEISYKTTDYPIKAEDKEWITEKLRLTARLIH